MKSLFCFVLFYSVVAFPIAAAEPAAKTPVLIDTDIGSDIDDAFALALAIASPELDVQGITTVGKNAEDRAWIVCRFLTHSGARPVPVAFGREPQPPSEIDWQIQYRRHPAPIFNRTQQPQKESAVEFLHARLKEQPGKLTIICLGPLTNVGRLLKEHPEAGRLIKRLVIMGGALRVGYDGKKTPEPEWNIKLDIPAAKEVFASGIPLTVVPLDATATVQLKKEPRQSIFSAYNRLTLQVQCLYELWDKETPILFDPVAVAMAFNPSFCKSEEMRLTIDDKGMTRRADGKPNARVATSTDDRAFVKWFVERLRGFGPASLPEPPKNLSKFVDRGKFPARVHVAEDFDTDIEKRWWMSGKLETIDVPPGGHRACRSVLTQDFDDRQGNMKTMYRAVIFNPVPGPPMGRNTRLTFSYKLIGTDRLRIQLYSLTNGYHRYLSLEKLESDTWQTGTVDMTQMRRPDGTGGPLSENERIDDIQFYVDPRAEVLIDDIVLYDAAVADEKQNFPRRILFTAWFDTGKRGKEWPGDFEIAEHEKPRTGKAARSVIGPNGDQWIRLGLRGERQMGESAQLVFRYRLSEGDAIRIELRNSKTRQSLARELRNLKSGQWSAARESFDRPIVKREMAIDEIVFRPPAGATLLLDDVLLFND